MKAKVILLSHVTKILWCRSGNNFYTATPEIYALSLHERSSDLNEEIFCHLNQTNRVPELIPWIPLFRIFKTHLKKTRSQKLQEKKSKSGGALLPIFVNKSKICMVSILIGRCRYNYTVFFLKLCASTRMLYAQKLYGFN
uniref:Uncharacterized protein n=1 Tax=Cacopsylla melanoneura TaxID=428564 RepID=A0A8D8WE51_9HEMI